MSTRALLLAALVAATPAEAGSYLEYPLPPAGMYEPTVPVYTARIPRAQLPTACGLTPERLVGCSLLWVGAECQIFIADDLPPVLEEEVVAHERAHCGGWTHGD